jgi:hypothetical protein
MNERNFGQEIINIGNDDKIFEINLKKWWFIN